MMIERTSAWAVAVVLVAGCTNNTISLNDDSGSESGGETDGTVGTDGTETSLPDSGSDDGPPPECVVDWDCGDCGWCSAGVCQEDVGCCGVSPENPWVWHCSPPWDCFDDSECPDGEVCNPGGYCEPDPNPGIQEPPACRGDLALSVAELPLDIALAQIAATEGGLWAIGEDLQVRPVSFDAGLGDPVGAVGGEQALELLPIDATTLVAVGVGTSIEGELLHQLARIHDPGDGSWSVTLGELQLAPAAAATWLQDPAEVIVGTEGQLARWTAALQPAGPSPILEAGALALTRLPFGAGGSSLAAVARDDGAVELWDVTAGGILADGHVLQGRPVDLAYAAQTGGGEPRLYAVSHVEPNPEELFPQDMAAVELVRIDAPLTATTPFGAAGIPVATAVADLDGNGIDDVLVANADGRLDLYLMEAEGPLCRAFLPLSPIVDLETGDVNGDGVADVLVLDAGPSLMAIHGAG